VEREVRWLTELIDNERVGNAPAGAVGAAEQRSFPTTPTTTPSVGDHAADAYDQE
jgi:hypothetical protein